MPPAESFLKLPAFNFGVVMKAFLFLFLVFYVAFSLILYRQIQLMGKTLPTPLLPFLRFLAIIHVGVALAILFFVLGVI